MHPGRKRITPHMNPIAAFSLSTRMAIAAALWRSRGRGCGPTEFFGAPILCGFDRVLEGFWDLGSLATRAIQEAQQPLNEDHTGREPFRHASNTQYSCCKQLMNECFLSVLILSPRLYSTPLDSRCYGSDPITEKLKYAETVR